VFVNRRRAQVPLVVDPEHVVAVEHAPQRTERVAKTEVDAADSLAGQLRDGVTGTAVLEVRVDQPRQRLERALVLLADPGLAEAVPLFLNKCRRDPRALAPGDAEPLPGIACRALTRPLAPKEAAPAKRGGQANEPA